MALEWSSLAWIGGAVGGVAGAYGVYRAATLTTKTNRAIAQISHEDTLAQNLNATVKNLFEQVAHLSTKTLELSAQLDTESTARRALQEEVQKLKLAATLRDSKIAALKDELAAKRQEHEESVMRFHDENQALRAENEVLRERLGKAEERLKTIEGWKTEDLT